MTNAREIEEGWLISALILWIINFVLFVCSIFGMTFFFRVDVGQGDLAQHHYHCKKLFYQNATVLLAARFVQYSFLIALALGYLSNNVFSVLYINLLDMATGMFLLVYGSLLLFWYSFFQIIQTRSLESVEVPYMIIFWCQIFVVGVAILNIFLCYFFLLTDNPSSFFFLQIFSFVCYVICLVGEMILAFIVGIKLKGVMNSPRNPYYYKHMSSRSIQVVLLSFVVTLIFLYRVVISLLVLVHVTTVGQPANPFLWSVYSDGWVSYLIYFLIGDELPIAVLLLFQSRLPQKSSKLALEMSDSLSINEQLDDLEYIYLTP